MTYQVIARTPSGTQIVIVTSDDYETIRHTTDTLSSNDYTSEFEFSVRAV